MREIKFRAWHHGRKRMFEVVGFNFKHGTVTLNDDGLHYVTAQDNVVIEQFTGLKDKNGVEIFEGDLIKGKYYSGTPGIFKRIIGVVSYRHCKFEISGIRKYEGLKEELHFGCEVIGNIHEGGHNV